MAEPKYRLAYFDVRGLGEPIRMIFAYAGVPFKDDRIPWDYPNWFSNVKKNYNSSVGQIPVLYFDNKELCNSQVISRYLAKQFGLVGDNDWDDARVNEVVAMAYDLFYLWRNTVFERDAERKANTKRTVLESKFRLCYQKWSSILEENKEGPFILGNKVTHADFWLANFISCWDRPLSGDGPVMPEGWPTPHESDIYVGMTKDYPLLKKHLEAVEDLPRIKEWIEKRHKTIC